MVTGPVCCDWVQHNFILLTHIWLLDLQHCLVIVGGHVLAAMAS